MWGLIRLRICFVALGRPMQSFEMLFATESDGAFFPCLWKVVFRFLGLRSPPSQPTIPRARRSGAASPAVLASRQTLVAGSQTDLRMLAPPETNGGGTAPSRK